jgi:hypothetical protein
MRCPFCGGKGAYIERLKMDLPNPYRVRCGDCGGCSGWASGRREAAALWSKRAGGSGRRWRRLCFENGRYAHEGD